jgi:hypothetical protein
MGLLDDAIREHLELKRQHGASDEEIERAAQDALTPARRDPSAGAGVPAVEDMPPPPPPPPAADDEPVAPPEAAEDVPPPPPPPVDEPVYADEYAAEPAPADPDAPEPSRPILYDDESDEDMAPEPARAPDIEPVAADLEPPVDQATRIRPTLETAEPAEAPPPAEPEPTEAPPPGTPKPHGDPAIDEDDLDADEVPAGEQLGGDDRYRARTTILDDPLADEPADDPLSPADPPPAGPPAGDQDDVLEETPDFLQETPEHDKLWFEQKPPRDFDFD